MPADKILVPIELDTWRDPVAFARRLGEALRAEVVVVHVVRPLVNVYPDLPGGLFGKVMTEVETESRRAVQEIATSAGARALVRLGDPVTEIMAAAEEEQATHLVLGTHGRRGIQRALLGSVADRVVRQSHVPVTIVPTAKP
jgi:nucleotide-binding universal stress UspA family protein